MPETGNFPAEMKKGALAPLSKPDKKVGPSEYIRPIMLLSMLRKILAICMLRRSLHKMLKNLPPTHAAYQQGRSTAEMVFSFEVLAEKAIASEDWEVTLLLQWRSQGEIFGGAKQGVVRKEDKKDVNPGG